MRLGAGTRLGPYEVTALIGEGGMGEVYRARDTRLHRDVALKVLPEAWARDADRMARFGREARLLASLNHPNIAAIYELEDSGRLPALVLELVPGPTLADRLARDPLPLGEALDVARQVADAIDAAHSRGVVHRDLKPANIKVRDDGAVKVLDFGIAKTMAGDDPSVDAHATTVVGDATRHGTVLGTPAYMSPEQARGERVDKRTDIWAFGCLLYEMLTGRTPFAGATAADTIAGVLARDPDWQALPGAMPDNLRHLLARCLEKHPKRRLHDIADARLELDDAIAARGAGARRSPPVRPASFRRLAVAAGIVVLAAVGVWTWTLVRPRTGPIRSLAVLPLLHAAPSADADYLADGISDSLINSLSQLPGVRVMARSTAFAFRGRDGDPRAVGRALGVEALLTGQLTTVRDTLVVRVQLVRAADGTQIWGDQFERRAADLLVLQQVLSSEIAKQLSLRLSGDPGAALARTLPENSEAYRLYLQGRFFWNKRTEDGLRTSVDYFERARKADPGYALAHVGLADAYNVLGFYAFLPFHEAFPKARQAAARALEIDAALSDAHNSLAYGALYYDWDFPAADRAFRRAIELNPNNPVAHQWHGNYLTVIGQWEAAIAAFDRARELDPLSLVINAVPAWTYNYARQPDRAIAACRRALEMEAGFALSHVWLGEALAQSGRLDEAIAALEKGAVLSARSPEIVALLGHAHAVAGRRDRALERLKELETLTARRFVSPYHLGLIHVGLGDVERALASLEAAYDVREKNLVFLPHDWRWDRLRSHGRFQGVIERVRSATPGPPGPGR